MYTADSVVVGLTQPDMTLDQWVTSLAGTPSADDAASAHPLIAVRGVSHRFLRAIFRHESSDGTKGICVKYQTHSPGNTRSSRTGKGHLVNTNVPQDIGGVIVPPSHQDEYVVYDTWSDGWNDLAFRLVDPTYDYVKQGRRTIRRILEIFAPNDDHNDTEAYIASVVAFMNALPTQGGTPVPTRPRVALSAGHHNSSGGDALEIQQTGKLTPVIAAACRARGMDVRVVQNHDGADMFPGDLSEVAQHVVDWDRAGWSVRCFIEIHTEGNASGDAGRGVFVIHPEADGDLDTDVRDRLGPAIANAISVATGIPLRGNGVMSEKQTGVGAQGFRLGVFRVTETLKAHCERLIVEVGSHTSPGDMAIWNGPLFKERAAGAIADALATYYNATQPQPTPPPQPDTLIINGQPIRAGFKALWESVPEGARLYVFGVPLGPERDVRGTNLENLHGIHSLQPFERCGWMVYQPHASPAITVATHQLWSDLEAA